mmetsp:Transcript_114866/g.199821  ORF Transcript_114866/g.199821 Transcript_114866/m.199821 type:complete len:164 (-) Transcript_114866:140-631(-)
MAGINARMRIGRSGWMPRRSIQTTYKPEVLELGSHDCLKREPDAAPKTQVCRHDAGATPYSASNCAACTSKDIVHQWIHGCACRNVGGRLCCKLPMMVHNVHQIILGSDTQQKICTKCPHLQGNEAGGNYKFTTWPLCCHTCVALGRLPSSIANYQKIGFPHK